MSIHVLSPQLANQIAAGEVVDRPSSVVKELLENSLDAGATHIEIDIERGGAKRIRILDNGSGITKEELTLALARHATSKITSLDDFESITSMGFRGEALASISSVSRLTLTSRTSTQNEAWQAYVEGLELTVILKPAAHPVGTTVDVQDLFYNTPVRRKFMRTEKTEFTHIDEVIRRIALSRFDVTFTLQHNGKTVRQYRAVSQQSQYLRRMSLLCGSMFVERALEVSWQHGDLALHGWIADLEVRKLPEMHYSYVNRRTIRDKLINHAIRRAYQEQFVGEKQSAFVLFLDVNPHQVDVNIHPAKHEVRFHQARLVHDFVYQGVVSVLKQNVMQGSPISKAGAESCVPQNRRASGSNHFFLPASKESSLYSIQQLYKDKEPLPLQKNVADFSHKASLLHEGQIVKRDICTRQHSVNDNSLVVDNNARHVGVATSSFAVMGETLVSALPANAGNLHGFGRMLTVIKPCYALIESTSSLALLSLSIAKQFLIECQLTAGAEQLRIQPLLIPLRIILSDEEAAVLKRYQPMLQEMGIMLRVYFRKAILNAIPLLLRQQNLQNLIPELLGYLHGKESVTDSQVAVWLAKRLQHNSVDWSYSQAIQLLAEIESFCPQWLEVPPNRLLIILNFEAAIKALNHD